MAQETSSATHRAPGISRRSFLAWSGLVGAGVALTGCSPHGEEKAKDEGAADATPAAFEYDSTHWSGCHVNCGSRCPLKLYVKDGTVVRVGNDNEGTDDFEPGGIYQMRSCVRGRTNRQRIYNETRVQKPLRRVEGTKRGEGQYEEISWDEAIEQIATTMKEIKDEYGNDAFYIQYGTGQLGGTVAKSWHPDKTAFARLMNLYGGYLRHYCDYSTGQINWELPLFNGDAYSNNEVTDLVNSKNIVLFGNNPANTRMSGSAMQYLITQVRLQNPEAHIVVVDPHLSDTAIGVANQWVPIRPCTDMALVAGMIHHLFTEGKLDEELIRSKFIGFFSDTFVEDVKQGEPKDTSFMGFDKAGALVIDEDMSYEAYLKGTGAYEGTGEKTPEWAAAITGVPADTIRALADLFVDGPTATIQGWGPQRHSAGGNNARAIALIAAITGNVGISGGGTGAREAVGGVPYKVATAIPTFPEKNTVDVCVSFFDWYHAIEDYQSMDDATWGVRHINEKGATIYAEEPGTIKLKAPIKFIWNYASNVMAGQHADINDSLRIYNLPDEKDSGVRMIVTVDCYLTPTALVSDIILPGTTAFEEDDIVTGGTAWTGFVCCESAAIEPLFEAKPVYEICTLIADKLGLKDQFTEGKSQLDWVKWSYEQGVRGVPRAGPVQEDGPARARHRHRREDRHAFGQVRGVLEAGVQPVEAVGPHVRRLRARRRARPDHGPAHLLQQRGGLRRRGHEGGLSLPADRPPHQDAHALVLRQRGVDEVRGASAVLDQRAGRRRARRGERRRRDRVHRARALAAVGEGHAAHHARRRVHPAGCVVRSRDARRRHHRQQGCAGQGRLHLGADVGAPHAHLQGQRRAFQPVQDREGVRGLSWNSTDFSSTPTSARAAKRA